jgi:hypothetical protein
MRCCAAAGIADMALGPAYGPPQGRGINIDHFDRGRLVCVVRQEDQCRDSAITTSYCPGAKRRTPLSEKGCWNVMVTRFVRVGRVRHDCEAHRAVRSPNQNRKKYSSEIINPSPHKE